MKLTAARSKQQLDMMTPREVAARSGIGVNAVYLLIQNRHIPSISIGRDLLVPRPQYQRWLETVNGAFDGASSRFNKNGGKPEYKALKRTNTYWASMTPEQRSQEVRRRRSLAPKKRK